MKQNSLSKPQISVYLSRRWLVTLPTRLFVAPPARSLGDALNHGGWMLGASPATIPGCTDTGCGQGHSIVPAASLLHSCCSLLVLFLVPHYMGTWLRYHSAAPSPPVTSESITKRLRTTGLGFSMHRSLSEKLCTLLGESNHCLWEFRSLLHSQADLQSCFSL